jgi:hypothetical protein
MFLRNYNENTLSPLKIFVHLALIIFFCAAAANPISAQINRSTYLDFTGDGKTDWAVFARVQTEGQRYTFKILGNQTGSAPSQPFIRIFDYGLATIDVIIPGDYIGDRKTDLMAYRSGQPSIFYVSQFPIGTGGIVFERIVRWGMRGDRVLQGDFDGDGKMDYTVVRRTGNELTWFILSSSTGAMRAVNFGSSHYNYEPVNGADFNGDGRDELVVTVSDINNRGSRYYWIGDAVTGAVISGIDHRGSNSYYKDAYLPPADYTGDGKADLVAIRRNVRQMIWYILDPATNTTKATYWGLGIENAGEIPDIPVRGDYDGDDRQDLAVYRQTDRTFYVLKSSDGGLIAQQWGEDSDYPLYVPLYTIIINLDDDSARVR